MRWRMYLIRLVSWAGRTRLYWYLVDLLYTTDLWINSLFAGERHETVSARWGKIRGHVRIWYWACRMLHWFDEDHCEKSAAAHEKIKEATK